MSVFKPDIFAGKVLFCTGGSTTDGICYKQTEAMMRHGCDAALFGRRTELAKSSAEKLSTATGRKCIGVSGDVRQPESLDTAVKETLTKLGRIDFVIAGAAGILVSAIDKLSVNAFKSVIDIDLLGTYNTLKATLPELKRNKGSFIAVSATLHRPASLLQAHVNAAKAGIEALLRVAAIEFGPFGVRFNTIAPGPIEGTEGVSRLMPTDKDGLNGGAKAIPMQRFGQRDDVANSTIYIFSPAASHVTGTHLTVDGGEARFHILFTSGAVLTFVPV
ncbi:MAG: hypothetical protein CYPHOPRED_002427 [Cyphobasidiales sp. Tagirdzhanova-0007]|nr:MAG: hypothetical protein CYPHOPRED_002427 [Cyphobasidiales sp. Tagirdzhanova-0007]